MCVTDGSGVHIIFPAIIKWANYNKIISNSNLVLMLRRIKHINNSDAKRVPFFSEPHKQVSQLMNNNVHTRDQLAVRGQVFYSLNSLIRENDLLQCGISDWVLPIQTLTFCIQIKPNRDKH